MSRHLPQLDGPQTRTRQPASMRRRRGARVVGLGLLAALAAACDAQPPARPGTRQDPAIYGVDDRAEVYAHASPRLRKLATDAVVTLMPASALDESDPDLVRLRATSLAVRHGVCLDAAFAGQPSAGTCTGVLVADDLVLTAGHCLTQNHGCADTRFVFDFRMSAPGEVAPLTSEDVFACSEVLFDASDPDLAIVRLDRSAVPRFAPVVVKSGDFALRPLEPLTLISSPSGVPLKIDDGAQVLDPSSGERDSFVTSADAFRGSSGGPLFDVHHELVGILVSGATDYVWTGQCYEPAVFPASGGGSGEVAVYAQRALEILCGVAPDAAPCTEVVPPSWCRTCTDDVGCPEDWSCQATAARQVSSCTPGCDSDLDCRSDHTCDTATGHCVAERAVGCLGGDVWELDACETPVRLLEVCVEGCADGECVVPCSDACVPGSTRCQQGMVQTCRPLTTATSACPVWDVAQACANGALCSETSDGCEPVDAWCTECTAEGQCPAGWQCGRRNRCQRVCGSDLDCREDHRCALDSGTCVPVQSTACNASARAAITTDACGAAVEARFCSPDSVCLDGRCRQLARPTCIVGRERCGGERTVVRCTVIDDAGTTAWRTVRECDATHYCDEGACRVDLHGPNRPGEPVDPTLRFDAFGDAETEPLDGPAAVAVGGGGCECATQRRGGAPMSWHAAWLVLTLVGLRARRTRRRRRCRRRS